MNIILWVMMACLIMCIVRTMKGPSAWDRLLGMSLMSTKLIVMIVVFATIYDLAYILDFAIIYALFGFIGTIFISIFLVNLERRTKK